MKMIRLGFIGFERWGSLRPAWKQDRDGTRWYPLFAGIWRSDLAPACLLLIGLAILLALFLAAAVLKFLRWPLF